MRRRSGILVSSRQSINLKCDANMKPDVPHPWPAAPQHDFSAFPVRALADEIRLYVEKGIRPKGVLMAILSGDLQAAFSLSEGEVQARIGEIAAFCYDHLPVACQGSRAIVERWLTMHEHPESITVIPSFDTMVPTGFGMALAA